MIVNDLFESSYAGNTERAIARNMSQAHAQDEDLNEFAPAGGGGSGDYFRELASAWYNGVFNTGSLPKGIKTQEDVERLLNRGIVCPDGKTRKLHIDYNSDFDGVEIYSDDYYEHGDHDDTIDSRTGQKWGPYDFMAFSDDQLDESAKYRDPKYKGQLYTQEPPDYMDTREYDRAMFDPKPDNYPGRKELPGGGEYDRTDPLVRGAGIGRSGIKNNILDRGKRKGLPSRDQITSLKQSIKDVSGRHTRANLPKESVNEFAADDGDSGEDDVLRRYAQMWWNSDDATQQKIEAALARMGWEIGEDEGGYDNGGVFVVRAGDEHGRSYTSWAAEDLTEGSIEKTATGLKHHGDFPDYPSSKGQQFQTDYDRLNKTQTGRLDKALGVRWEPTNNRKEISGNPTGVDEGVAEGHADQERKIFKKNGKPVGEVGIDRESSPGNGQWYMTCYGVVSYGGYDSYEEAVEELKHCLKQGVAEGSDDPFGSQGRYVGDTGPKQISTTVPRVQLQIGDQVVYKPTEQRARIVAMSRDGSQARVEISTPMGGRVFNCKTSDLKSLGRGLAEGLSTMLANATSRDDLRQIRNFVTEHVSDQSQQRKIMEQATRIVAVQRRKYAALSAK